MSKFNTKINPMYPAHVSAAIEIISEHDEDDAEYARESYGEGLENQYVYQEGKTVLGVTGFDISDDVATISWTYIARKYRGQGHGSEMMRQLLEMMGQLDLRKVYVQTSDYREDASSPMLYADAIKLYKKLGFEQEAYHSDYYDEGEGMFIFGKRLRDARSVEAVSQRENANGIELEDVFLIDESETSYGIEWSEYGSSPLSADLLSAAVKYATSKGATAIFISFPSTFTSALSNILGVAGFFEEGQLMDYHADGVHEIRYKLRPDTNIS